VRLRYSLSLSLSYDKSKNDQLSESSADFDLALDAPSNELQM
jgi:hypothetical protein